MYVFDSLLVENRLQGREETTVTACTGTRPSPPRARRQQDGIGTPGRKINVSESRRRTANIKAVSQKLYMTFFVQLWTATGIYYITNPNDCAWMFNVLIFSFRVLIIVNYHLTIQHCRNITAVASVRWNQNSCSILYKHNSPTRTKSVLLCNGWVDGS